MNAVAGPDTTLDALAGATDTDKCQGVTPAGDEVLMVMVQEVSLREPRPVPASAHSNTKRAQHSE